MPRNNKETKDKENNAINKGTGRVLGTVLTFLALIVAVSVVLGGAFYLVIHNNINGLAEKYRSTIQNIPVARLALPEPEDPSDPQYMTDEEIKEAYLSLKDENLVLKKQLEDAKAEINELQEFKSDYDKHMSVLDNRENELNLRESSLNSREDQLNKLKDTIDALIASGNPEAFIEFFEELDEENAKAMYQSLIVQQYVDENVNKFIKLYESMESDAAAAIFEEMGTGKIDLIAETLKGMSKTAASEILAAMTPEFAAKVTEKLDSLYRERPKIPESVQ